MKIGYARVSTDEQSLELQITQLKAAGCALVFEEKQSGKSAARAALQKLLQSIELKCPECRGLDDCCRTCGGHYPDVLVVTKLDRLARNTRDLLEIVDRLGKAGAGLLSLGEPWADTTSPAGRMVMTVLGGVAEFERARILERTSEGRALAKKNGVRFGRPQKLSLEKQRAARKMLDDGATVRSVSRLFNVNRKTLAALRDQK